jgi:hypothetical protein
VPIGTPSSEPAFASLTEAALDQLESGCSYTVQVGPFHGLELRPNVPLVCIACLVVHRMDDPTSLRRRTILLVSFVETLVFLHGLLQSRLDIGRRLPSSVAGTTCSPCESRLLALVFCSVDSTALGIGIAEIIVIFRRTSDVVSCR